MTQTSREELVDELSRLRQRVEVLERERQLSSASACQLQRQLNDQAQELERANQQLKNEVRNRDRIDTQLQQSESRFRQHYENNPVPITMWQAVDDDFVMRDLNPAGEEMVKATAESLRGSKLSVMFGDFPEFLDNFRECVSSKTPIIRELEHRILTSGEVKQLRVHHIFVEPDIVMVHSEDITERKKSDQLLRQSHERYQDIVEMAEDCIWEIDLNWQTTFSNDRINDLLGYTDEELAEFDTFALLHPDDAERANRLLPQWMAEKKGWSHEIVRLRKKCGEYCYLECSAVPILDKQGELIGYRGVNRDVTDRVQVEQKLRSNENLLQAIMDHAPLLISAKLRDGTIMMANKRFEVLEGPTPKEFIGKNVYDIFPSDIADELWKNDLAALETGEPLEALESVVHKDGSLHTYQTIKFPLYGESDEAFGTCAISLDNSDRLKAEELLRESESRLQEAQARTHIGSWVWDIKTGVVTWSDELYRIFGRDPSQGPPSNDTWQENIVEEDRKIVVDAVAKAVSGENDYNIVYRLIRYDNQQVSSVHAQGMVYRDDLGNPNLMVGTVQDITEQRLAEASLRESQMNLSAVLENTVDVILSVDKDYRILTINSAGIAAFSQVLKADVEIGHDVISVVPLQQRASWIARFDRAFSGERFVVEDRETINGIDINFETSFYPIFDGKDITSVSVWSRNTTERKRAEDAISKSEQKYRGLFDDSLASVFIFDADRNILDVNFAGVELLGYSKNELIGKNSRKIDADPDAVKSAQDQVLSGDRLIGFVHDLKRKDGQIVTVLNNSRALKDAEGRIIGAQCTLMDITELKKAEATVQLYADTVDRIQVGLFVFHLEDLDDANSLRLVAANPAASLATGADMKNLLGKTMIEAFPTATESNLPEIYADVVRSGIEKQLGEVRYEDTRISQGVFSVNAFPLLNNHMCVAFTNITDKKQAEEEKDKLQEELRHSHKMEAVGQLGAGVAHEFNNIIAAIRSNAEILLYTSGDLLTEQLRRPLKDIERAGARAFGLTQKLLSFARQSKPNRQAFDINPVVTISKSMLNRLVGSSIHLETELSLEPAFVLADEADLEQAIVNLVVNARDAMPDGGSIVIETRILDLEQSEVPLKHKAGQFVQLSVIDQGCGMSPETSGRIFEPFFTTKPVGKGTGLGLSTVYADIEKSGGFLTVDSTVGLGTTIRILLPFCQAAKEEAVRVDIHSDQTVGGNETILVCDDEEIVLSSVCALLENVGYSVFGTHSAREALEVAEKHRGEISLLLTDVTMPEMDGVELGKQINRLYPEVKVIYSSGFASDRIEILAKSDEFVFLEKGGLTSEIIQRIRKVLDDDKPNISNHPLKM